MNSGNLLIRQWYKTSNLLMNCLSVFYHFVGLALKGLREFVQQKVCSLINYCSLSLTAST